MADEQPLYHPRQLYETQLSKQYHYAADQYFNELADKARTDQGMNALHVKQYNAALAELEAAKKKLNAANAGKGWAIAGIIVSFLVALILIIVGIANASSVWWLILIGVAFVGLGIFLIVTLATRVKKALAAARALVEEKEKKAKAALDVCYADMASLNALFDDFMPGDVMEKTTPLIDLDPIFSPERFSYLHERFGMQEETDPGTSVLGVISGNIQGNPFVLEKVARSEIQDKVYHGELTIHWTTTHRDSKGNTYTEHHTEVLHAETVHPAPAYWDETRLIFGSEVAPHLCFTRRPSGMSGKSEKEMEKFVKSRVKELDKKEEKAIKEGRTFTKLGNDEFDAFFGADNRNNEVEYRLMFTALAQKNMLDLLKKPEPFGDDFIMHKEKMLTSIASKHSQNFNYQVGAKYFRHYDFVEAKKRFVSYCDAFIKNLFFDLAPILSIPLYQLHKPAEYIYGGGYPTNMTSFEHEAMINKMNAHLFMPEGADPKLPLILKQANSRPVGESDEVGVLSRSYRTTEMVDYVSKMGGDGRMHQVPVPWIQYDEVSCTRNVGLSNTKKSRPAFEHVSLEPLKKYLSENFSFDRGLLSFYLGAKNHLSDSSANEIDSFFAKE